MHSMMEITFESPLEGNALNLPYCIPKIRFDSRFLSSI